MPDSRLESQIDNIIGGAVRRAPILSRQRSALLCISMITFLVGGVLFSSSAVVGMLQQRQAISDTELRQIQSYVCLISETGEATADRLWHELKLFLDIERVDKLRRADFDRAIEWLDRRARRALERPDLRRTTEGFCGFAPG